MDISYFKDLSDFENNLWGILYQPLSHYIKNVQERDVGLMFSDGGGGSRGLKLEGQYLEDFGDPGVSI